MYTTEPVLANRGSFLPYHKRRRRERHSLQHWNPPVQARRWRRWFWCGAAFYCTQGKWWIHFQLSSGETESNQESKTMIPFWDFQISRLASSGIDWTSSNLFPCSKFMVFAYQPIVAENLILVLQILSEGKGFLTNKQSKAVKFQTVLVLFREA